MDKWKVFYMPESFNLFSLKNQLFILGQTAHHNPLSGISFNARIIKNYFNYKLTTSGA